jgi:uncharacterized membrane protein (UPF0182 family)
MVPFTPSNKDNMIAWLAARCDGARYGERLVFNFPKQSLVFGPRQIEARIDQDPTISQELTLWSQSGSQVIRGNLLVIPIGQGLLYVEPLYLQAEQGELPELKRVILSNSEDIVMEETLDLALASLVGGIPGEWRTGTGAEGTAEILSGRPASTRSGGADGTGAGVPRTPSVAGGRFGSADAPGSGSGYGGAAGGPEAEALDLPPGLSARIEAARSAFADGQRALRNNDWAAYGRAQERLRRILESLSTEPPAPGASR